MTDLKYPDNTFDLIRSSHTLEHVDCNKTHLALSEQFRVLKPNCFCRVIVPGLDKLIERLNNKEKYKTFWDLMKNDKGLWNSSELRKPFATEEQVMVSILYLGGEHKNSFTYETLKLSMEHVGFVDIECCDDEELGVIPDSTVMEISLRLKGRKPLVK